MKILVTGASGFIGRNLCEYFSGEHEVFSPPQKKLELLDESAVSSYIKQNHIETIIHCANKGGTRDAAEAERVVEDNLRMFFNVARNSHLVDRIIYFGSGAEFGKQRDLHKVTEEQFDEIIPKDDYGFYKYVCNKCAEKSENIYNLRLFGVFGKYENYEMRFISNTIVKNLLGLDITIKQNVIFDYLYIPDLMSVVGHFLKNKPKFHSYNVTPDDSIDLLRISELVNLASQRKSKISVANGHLNYEYTGSNSRLKGEIGEYKFTGYPQSIKELFAYYSENLSNIDKNRIMDDPHLSKCKTRSDF